MGENVTVLFVAHLNKGGGTFRQRINGAVGLSNAPRSVIGMARDPEDENRNVVAHVKGNLTKPPVSLIFEFVETEVEIDGQDAPATMLKLAGTTGMKADDLVAPRDRETKADRAVEFLRDALTDGPLPSKELNGRARGNEISDGTLAAARKREGLVSRRDGKGWAVGYPHQFPEE
jgi:putative DNA primase/helicase